MSNHAVRLLVLVTALPVLLVALAGVATAHPLGNVTTNTALAVTATADTAQLEYVLDLAEIPTVQARQRIDADGDDQLSPAERDAYATSRCAELLGEVRVMLDGDPLQVTTGSAPTLEFLDGEAGLSTLRLTCTGTADWTLGPTTQLALHDDNTPDRIGWREIVIQGDGATVTDSDVPTTSPTDLLRTYPQDQLGSPLRTTTATATIRPGGSSLLGGGAAADTDATAGPFERLTTAYTDLVATRELTPGFALLAVLIAILLGSLHALAPGHGKTVMAAYVVGQRGTLRQALTIGGTVATTHTLGVLLLGVALSLSETFVPDRLFGWFEITSGLIIVAIGVALLRRARRGGHDHAHHHGHGHGHHHVHDTGEDPGEDPGHTHTTTHATHPEHATHPPSRVTPASEGGTATAVAATPTTGVATHSHDSRAMSRRELIGLGVAGGLVPSPSALVVLLGAVAIGRAWFGVGLVAAYGLGLALTLVGAGLLLVRARHLAERLMTDDGRLARLSAVLPTITAAVVVVAGLVVVARGALL